MIKAGVKAVVIVLLTILLAYSIPSNGGYAVEAYNGEKNDGSILTYGEKEVKKSVEVGDTECFLIMVPAPDINDPIGVPAPSINDPIEASVKPLK